jgi:hypothetical protein
MMPTKKKLVRKNAIDEKWNKLGPIPDYIAKDFAASKNKNSAMYSNMGIYKGGLVAFDKEGEPYLHPKTGMGASTGYDVTRDNAEVRVDKLKQEYPDLWGKRGAPKVISLDTGIPLRTVQNYFKKYPAK